MNDEELTIKQQMNKYMGQGFNQAQLEEIRIGLEDELDVTFYARPDMPASEMMWIRKELFKRHIINKQNQQIEDSVQPIEESAAEQLQKIKSRRELAIIAIVMFAISLIGFFILLANI